MGEINAVSEKLCAISGVLTPDVSRRAIFVMAGDHGVCAEGVSSFPQDVTMLMMQTMLEGRSTVCVYANHTGTRVFITDIGTLGEVKAPENFSAVFYDRKIAKGTANFTKTAAMSRADAGKSILTGFETASENIKKYDLNLITTGEMGIGNTTPSAAIAAVFTGMEPEILTGCGAGLDNAGWLRKVEAVKKGLHLHSPSKDDPVGVLATVGGYEIGGMAGVMLAAAVHKIPVILDGVISTAAALIAYAIAPDCREYMIAGHESEERGHKYMLDYLKLTPLLRLGMRLGEGTGAVCAIPLVELAAATITKVATLTDAGVVKK
jgi:nicotinate-nucleotide--dimethylbenzimidazole phosphoribosyltransferase